MLARQPGQNKNRRKAALYVEPVVNATMATQIINQRFLKKFHGCLQGMYSNRKLRVTLNKIGIRALRLPSQLYPFKTLENFFPDNP